jgi:glycosyltransferase involved in cell wall biosynthesis
MSSPIITIIVPVLNRASDLSQTLDSIFHLGGSVLIKCIVVDGGSTDGTLDIIKGHEMDVEWISEPDRGVYDAMNRGWAMAALESYILVLGAGDRIISLPGRIASPHLGEAVCGVVEMGRFRYFMPKADWRLKMFNSVHHQALLVPKCLHPQPPFNVNYPRYADFDFNQRLFKMGVKFRFDDSFVAYALPGGISDHPCFRETACIVRRNFGAVWWITLVVTYFLSRILPAHKCFTSIKAR